MISFLLSLSMFSAPVEVDLSLLELPDGHKIEVVAQAQNVRQLAQSYDGTLFAGSRRAGNVYALVDKNRDGNYESTILISSGLNMPSGVAVKGNDLYVAEVERILVFKNILPLDENNLPPATVYFDRLPNKRHHGWKYLKFGPDGLLYFNIGAPCNICLPEHPFATLVRLTETKRLEVIASGVRNSVGFTWNPNSKKMWFTDNGRDHLGDDLPSDELNRIDTLKQHFGYPYMHANNVNDPIYGKQGNNITVSPPAYELGAHVAPLGLTFYTGNTMPESNTNTLYVAEHGSWNRSEKSGYRIVKLQIENGEVVSHQPFIQGWMRNEEYWGRPNDIIVDQDGSLLISDDYAGVVYRISATE